MPKLSLRLERRRGRRQDPKGSGCELTVLPVATKHTPMAAGGVVEWGGLRQPELLWEQRRKQRPERRRL